MFWQKFLKVMEHSCFSSLMIKTVLHSHFCDSMLLYRGRAVCIYRSWGEYTHLSFAFLKYRNGISTCINLHLFSWKNTFFGEILISVYI